MKFLDELKALNLPPGKYVIFGSGPLAVRGLRECHDLDIIVKQDVWEDLIKTHAESLEDQSGFLVIGHLEISNTWLGKTDLVDELIDTAEIINGFPYARLSYVIEWKKQVGREKDKKDLELIKKYLADKKWKNPL